MSRMLTRVLVCVMASMVLSSAWADSPKTPAEAKVVDRVKTAYAQHGLPFTQAVEDQVLARYRKVEAAQITANALIKASPDANLAQRQAIMLGAMQDQGLQRPAHPNPVVARVETLKACWAAHSQQPDALASCKQQADGTPVAEPPGEAATLASINRDVAAKMAAAAGGHFVSGSANAVGSVPAGGAAPSITSTQLAQEVAQRHAQGALTVFTPRQDGFVANGQTFVDPVGEIVMFGGDTASGDVTYFVRNSPGTLLVRFANVHSSLPPVTMGTIQLQSDRMQFQSADGTQVAGENIIPAGRGVIVARATTVFDYTFGGATTHQLLPANYGLAPYQRGDAAGTGYVLLRREISRQEKGNVVKAFAGLFHAVTNSEDDKDYALFNVRTGNTVYLNVAESDEQVGHGVACRPKNAFVNRCAGWVSHASLYQNDGQPNYLHYYWRIDWAQTPVGPIAVALEKGVENVDAIQLDTDTVKTVFHRVLGIQSAQITQNPDGTLAVTANWAFRHHTNPNVDALFGSGATAQGATPSQSTPAMVANKAVAAMSPRVTTPTKGDSDAHQH